MRTSRIVIVRRISAVSCVVAALSVLAIYAAATPRGSIATPAAGRPRVNYEPRKAIDMGGYAMVTQAVKPWAPDASPAEIAESWRGPGYRNIERLAEHMKRNGSADPISPFILKAMLLNYEGEARQAYETLAEARSLAEAQDLLAREWLPTIIYFQGVTALRVGENENCIMCRGESSCILPISAAAVHRRPRGSRLAIGHFGEALRLFPDDLEARWLLNIAHMTLGEHPETVDPASVISLEGFRKSEFDIGKFKDVGHLVGANRLNQAGGAIMEDFDGDGRLDLVTTTIDPTMGMSFLRNKGDGTFEERAEAAGLGGQLGGLNCVQSDYDNDGHMDIFIVRGAWLQRPMRPTLLHNNGDGTFADVTVAAGLSEPTNSICASWADYDNDGHLDLFVCGECQPSRLYHNRGDGTFQEVASEAGVLAGGLGTCKGAAWFDFDNDDYPDLFVNFLNKPAQLYHNDRDGHFSDVTLFRGINGPGQGFSCWAWDYDNDGWLDIFATCYDHSLEDVVKGLIGVRHSRLPNKLYHNERGRGFRDVTREAGLDSCFAAMGSNFGDFDNDGFPDMYLGTGDPNLSTLIPNRMFKNVGGTRFAEITGTSGTGHLQKGHGVACGDWDRDGSLDIFVETGGAINGDKFRNILSQNPGQGNHRLTVKLVGAKSNRAAIGARIKAVTDGDAPLIVQRHVTSGSSFGANPLRQTLGLAKASRVARLEIHWPTSGTTQVLENIEADQDIEVTELSEGYKVLDSTPIPVPIPQ